ncbi:uncharacterized [Tachysurus ichikawai]
MQTGGCPRKAPLRGTKSSQYLCGCSCALGSDWTKSKHDFNSSDLIGLTSWATPGPIDMQSCADYMDLSEGIPHAGVCPTSLPVITLTGMSHSANTRSHLKSP